MRSKTFLPGSGGGRTAAVRAHVFALRKTSPRFKERQPWMGGAGLEQQANWVLHGASARLWEICRKSKDRDACLSEVGDVMGKAAARIGKIFRKVRD